MKNILIINASLRGVLGNSYQISLKAKPMIEQNEGFHAEIYTLAHPKKTIGEVYELLVASDAFLVVSGTYWSNFSSLMQQFVEICTQFENSSAFFGKPCSAVVSLDSVGGTEVASKIIQVFLGFGCWSPPCSSVVVSRVGEFAVRMTANEVDDPNKDVWRLEDMEILLQNLMTASQMENDKWKVWPFEKLKLKKDGDWPNVSPIVFNSDRFL